MDIFEFKKAAQLMLGQSPGLYLSLDHIVAAVALLEERNVAPLEIAYTLEEVAKRLMKQHYPKAQYMNYLEHVGMRIDLAQKYADENVGGQDYDPDKIYL